jgi:hypothetical protein
MTPLLTWLETHPHTRTIALTLYYLGIVAALIAMYGQGHHAAPEFVYEGF